MTTQIRFAYPLSAMAAALLAAFGSAYAADGDDITALTKPSSSVSLGLGYVDKDNGRFGQYNGLNEKGGYGLADVDFVTRDDTTGTWFSVRGRGLGLDHRELSVTHEVQGNWGYSIEYSQIPRFEPYTVTTAITGIGTDVLTVPTAATTGSPVKLQTERERLTLGFNKYLPGKWDVKVTFRNEKKEGARVFGRGTTTGSSFEFAPEPIDSTTQQVEATVGYNGDRLQFVGGYYGTTYDNKFRGLTFIGGAAGLASFTPIGLPPDNQSHQLHFTGGYNFSATTRGSFKVAFARAEQDDTFVTGVPLAPGVGTNLQGRVDTTQVQGGLVSRLMPALTVRASLRFEDRDDKTPLVQYISPGGSTYDGFNEPRSIRTTSGKVEASYALPASLRLTGGLEYEEKKRNTSPLRVVSYRETTDETTYRVELRRSMSETLTGAIGLIHSDRGGSPFILTTVSGGGPGSNLIAPIHLADRKRDTVRVSGSWQPTDPFSLQFRVDHSQDDYEGDRSASGLGPREGKSLNAALDAAYSFTDEWQGTAWFSHNRNEFEQLTDPTNTWLASLSSKGRSVGLGVRGKLPRSVQVGADLSFSDIDDVYTQLAIVGPAVPTIPDVNTQLTRLNVFAKYPLQKNAGIRVDYVYDRFKTDDWTWTTWTYTDGTTLRQDPDQKVNFLGVSYYYRF